MTIPVYPRWRGEHHPFIRQDVVVFGLSPLARGTPKTHGFAVAVPRFIPAGAGNTLCKQHRGEWKSVYPRWRGEHVNGRVGAVDDFGLSPLARGTLIEEADKEIVNRFIPAGAGNTHHIQKPKI